MPCLRSGDTALAGSRCRAVPNPLAPALARSSVTDDTPGRTRRALLAAAPLAALSGCSALGDGTPTVGTRGTLGGAPRVPPAEGHGVAYTFGRPTGNRVVEGTGSVPDADPVDVGLGGRPAWVVGTAAADGDFWVVALADGSLVGVVVADGGVSLAEVRPARLPAGSPPALDARGDGYRLLRGPDDAGPAAHPTAVGDATVTPTTSGDVVIARDGDTTRLGVDALPDGRIVTDEAGRAAVPAGPSDRYGHGALGDGTEPTAVTVVDVAGSPSVEGSVRAPSPAVFETLFPFWVRWNDRRVFVLTEAVSGSGARATVYAESGERLATGPRVTGGLGWTHRLAVAPFAPDGTTELATVTKPHVERELRYLRWRGDRLETVATASPWVSHTLSDQRNTDRVRAGDFDGDGRVELLVPTVDGRRFGGLRRTPAGVTVAWELPLGGRLTTNLAAVGGDGISVAAGRADGVLRIWPRPGAKDD